MNRMHALFPVLLLLLSSVARSQPVANVQELSKLHCAACHGENLDGGLGGSLVDGVWQRGSSDADLTRVIREGIPEMGMLPYEKILAPEEIRSLVIFIRERENAQLLARQESARPTLGQTVASEKVRFRPERVAAGLDIPWSLAFLPDGSFLVTERPGTLRIISPAGELGPPISGLPPILHRGQGGLMEVALHPDYAKNGWVYLGFTAPHPDPAKAAEGLAQTKVVRGRIRDGRWEDEETIWQAALETYGSAGVHFGIRMVFHDGYLWFTLGDRGQPPQAQNLSRPEGKIFRLHDDGRIPEDNPFRKTPGALPEIWSYGHRNPQGLVRHPKTGELLATEHGPRGGDELNRIQPAVNYGWPEVTYGMNYNGTPITSRTEGAEFTSPVVQWTPSIAACGLAVAHGSRYPAWEGDVFAGGLASQQLRRVRIRGGQVVEDEIVLRGLGRIRDVRFGPDGLLYLVLNEPHEIVRLLPE